MTSAPNADKASIDPANAVSSCGGQITAVPGSNVISLGGVPAATVDNGAICTIAVDVLATGIGSLHNISGELPSSNFLGQDASSGIATATLEVIAEDIILTKRFLNDPVPAGGNVTLRYTVINRSRDDAATDISFTDDLSQTLPGLMSTSPAQQAVCGPASTLSGDTVVKLTGGGLPPGGSCTFTVQLAVPNNAPPGEYPSTTSPIVADIAGSSVQGHDQTWTRGARFVDQAERDRAGSGLLVAAVVQPEPDRTEPTAGQ